MQAPAVRTGGVVCIFFSAYYSARSGMFSPLEGKEAEGRQLLEEGRLSHARPFTAALCALVKVPSVAQVLFLTKQGGCAISTVIL